MGQLSRPLGILQSNSNSMPSSAAVSGRNPLFNTRDNRGKIGESLSAFDPSEFPSLGSRENSSAPNPALARSNYVNMARGKQSTVEASASLPFTKLGMVKQPAMEASEFTMSNEDFPALPGLSGPA